MNKIIGNVYETNDYTMFKFKEENRILDGLKVNALIKQLKQDGKQLQPIIVNKQYEIFDGQHRYNYAKNNNLPIYYMIIPGLTKEDFDNGI